MTTVVVRDGVLRGLVRRIFASYGFPDEDAEIIADHLVSANLRGVDSHGVIRVRYYIEGVERGYVKPCGDLSIARDMGHIVVADGCGCLGVPVAAKAMRIAVERAKRLGVSVVAVGNLGHVGMLAYYSLMAAREGLIGFACANGPAIVVPFGGSKPLFGTNPLTIAFPTASKPIVIDMATSAIASFKVRLAALRGESIPEGVAIDSEGRVTTDPSRVYAILPFGGYKGYAISLAVEILAGILAGKILGTKIVWHGSTQGGFFATALDPTKFIDLETYLAMIDELVREIKSCPPAKGFTEVLLPGEPEDRIYEQRLAQGIPLDEEIWNTIVDIARKQGIEIQT